MTDPTTNLDIEQSKKISDIRKYVIEEIVQPNYITKIKSAFKWQRIWAFIYGMTLGTHTIIDTFYYISL